MKITKELLETMIRESLEENSDYPGERIDWAALGRYSKKYKQEKEKREREKEKDERKKVLQQLGLTPEEEEWFKESLLPEDQAMLTSILKKKLDEQSRVTSKETAVSGGVSTPGDHPVGSKEVASARTVQEPAIGSDKHPAVVKLKTFLNGLELSALARMAIVKHFTDLLDNRDSLTEADIIDFAAEKARRAEFDAMDALRAKLEDPNLSRFQRRAYQATLDTLEAEAAEEEEMRDKEERRKGLRTPKPEADIIDLAKDLHTQLVSKPEAERDVEDLMGTSFEDSIARMKARLEKEEDPRKRKDLEKMIATQERNLAMLRGEKK